jgi:signal transduction histidine kinase
VLVVHSSRRDAPYTVLVENALRTTIGDALGGRFDYYVEYVDAARFSGPGYTAAVRDFLRNKYREQRLDVVIADGETPFEFLVRHRAELFPGVPLIFSKEGGPHTRVPNSAGVVFPVDMKSTLDLALKLHPNTRSVAVIVGSSAVDRFYEGIARGQFRGYEDQVAFTYVTPKPFKDLRKEVAQLPQASIVYFVSLFEDGTGDRFIPVDILRTLAEDANAPMYCWPEMTLGDGIVGGDLLSEEAVARSTGQLAVRVLRGESPDSIPVGEIRPYVKAFDARQLRRWGISEDCLPPDAVVRFKEESLWRLYRWRIVGVLSLVVGQAVLIVGLLVHRRQRHRAETRARTLAGRLLTAQEAERANLSRELHDDACQEIARIAVDLSHLQQKKGPLVEPDVRRALGDVRKRVSGLAESLRLVSHDLHPPVLKHLGLVGALQAHCAEVERSHGIRVALSAPAEAEPWDTDGALGLFRITQEALRNAHAHGRARRATVSLQRQGEELVLTITDDGVGFDAEAVPANGGLGLVSIDERAQLLQGTAVVRSRTGEGTTVQVRVPDRRSAPPPA